MIPARQSIDERLVALAERELPGLDFAAPLMDQLNSLQLLGFALLVQKEFSVPVANVDITEENFSSLPALASLIARKKGIA